MLNSGFKILRDSDHFASLQECIEKSEGESLLDIGCGSAEAFTTFKQFKYMGADLPHIIEKVSKKKNPDADYRYFNANTDSYDFINKYDIVLMNSFISELPDWYRVLTKVLVNAKKFVIVHRQEVTNHITRLQEYVTYGDLRTSKTIINYNDLVNMFEMNGYNIVYEGNSRTNDSSQKTFLLRNRNDK